jgi:NADH-quinone oxidoreductase subunit G
MPKLTIDGIEVNVEPGTTVLQACEIAGKEIPRFCYHERLSIAGNCRMCLVEQEKAPKPIASCAMPAADGMVIKTDTPMVKKAREGVMEFLLINHPLDCPICDQGGECDLQDQAMGYGRGYTRYDEYKRAVTEKYMGPLVATSMTRCIHCTRCVRFITEVAGVAEMGAIGRGEDMEITTYLEKALTSELSANVVDLCPVGALTSKPYAFHARPWELGKTESVDVMDALGSNIRIDNRGREVLRVLPRLNEEINEEWLGDKSRHAIDGLHRRRLDRPYVRRNGKLQAATWNEAFAAIAAQLNGLSGPAVAAIAGDLACTESMTALKDLMGALGSPNLDCRQDGAKLGGARGGYIFNSGISGIDQADAILLVGTNPRLEAPVLNARIRKRYLRGNVRIAAIGPETALTYKTEWLGNDATTVAAICNGNHPFAEVLRNAKNPMVIVGQGALARADGAAVFSAAKAIGDACVREGWNGFNVLHTAAARVGGLDIGFVPGQGGLDVAGIQAAAQSGAVKAVFLLGADELDTQKFGTAFVVYIGTHGDAGAHRADVILPAAAYTEKDATWVNTEGRVQLGRRAVAAPGDAREDWTILRALSAVLGKTLPYDTLGALRKRMLELAPHFAAVDRTIAADWAAVTATPGTIAASGFTYAVSNYYLTNPIARASETMAACSAELGGHGQDIPGGARTGTHG